MTDTQNNSLNEFRKIKNGITVFFSDDAKDWTLSRSYEETQVYSIEDVPFEKRETARVFDCFGEDVWSYTSHDSDIKSSTTKGLEMQIKLKYGKRCAPWEEWPCHLMPRTASYIRVVFGEYPCSKCGHSDNPTMLEYKILDGDKVTIQVKGNIMTFPLVINRNEDCTISVPETIDNP